MGNCSSTSKCNPCGPDYDAINLLATKTASYARQANTYAVNAENSWLEFNALYLGAFAVAPTVDNEGNPLQTGALYWNTGTNTMFAWDGTVWVENGNFNEFTPFLATGTTFARNLVTRAADVINVKDFGAVGNGVTDDTAAIQAAINYAQTSSFSRTVLIPATKKPASYRITAPLLIQDRPITLVGEGVSGAPDKNNDKRSILFFDHLGIGINVNNAVGVIIDGIESERNQPIPSSVPATPWVPLNADFDYVFQNNAIDGTIQNCLIRNATKGIKSTGLGYGKTNIFNLKMHAFQIGIDMDGIYDVPRIENVHIWPFWYVGNSNVVAYTKQNLIGMNLGRVDNPKISNSFTWSAKYGIRFYWGVGMSERAEIVNCGFDNCGVCGIYFNDNTGFNQSAQISNTYSFDGDYAILFDSIGTKVLLSNFRSTNANKNAIRMNGSDNILQISNIYIDYWNTDNAGHQAIFENNVSSNEIYVDTQIVTIGGNGAAKVNDSLNIRSYEWIDYTPIVATAIGTINSYTATARYSKQNNIVKYQARIEIIDAGTALGTFTISLPFTSSLGFRSIGSGRTGGGIMVGSIVPQSFSGAEVFAYNNSNIIINGNIIFVSGEYKI